MYASGESEIETPSFAYIIYSGSSPFSSNYLFMFIIEVSYVITAS